MLLLYTHYHFSQFVLINTVNIAVNRIRWVNRNTGLTVKLPKDYASVSSKVLMQPQKLFFCFLATSYNLLPANFLIFIMKKYDFMVEIVISIFNFTFGHFYLITFKLVS